MEGALNQQIMPKYNKFPAEFYITPILNVGMKFIKGCQTEKLIKKYLTIDE
jgi:hypothetical protein